MVDFVGVTDELIEGLRRVWKLLVRLMHSARDFLCRNERQDQLALLDGHAHTLGRLVGVPQRMV